CHERAAGDFFVQRILTPPCLRVRAGLCVGTALIRPFDVRDDINEPTRTYLRRVVAGAYQRRGYRKIRRHNEYHADTKNPRLIPRRGLFPAPSPLSDWYFGH